MRALFVSSSISMLNQGAYETAALNLLALKSIYGNENVDAVSLSMGSDEKQEGLIWLKGANNKLEKLINCLRGYKPFYSRGEENTIIRLISERKYGLIWMNEPGLGKTVRRIKKQFPQLPCFVYHQGVATNTHSDQYINGHKNMAKLISYWVSLHNEHLSAQYADKHLLLNKRDEDEFFKSYGCHADAFLPVCFIDRAHIEAIPKDSEFRLLFVGGNFGPNVDGVMWFVQNVMPYINTGKLYIVGNRMELLKSNEIFQRENVEIIGGVKNLDYWYNSADLVVAPIRYGDGMKTKTAEAFMYGKHILGTTEALCGYDDTECFLCETAGDFIEKINWYIQNGVPRFDPDIRKRYEDRYSLEAAVRIITVCVEESLSQDER